MFALQIVGLAKTEEERDKLYRAYEKQCEKYGIDPLDFRMDVLVPRFRCDYRLKVFVTFFTKDGNEIETEGVIPYALKINSYSSKRKTEMLPGEIIQVFFSIPEGAKFWYVWVPK